MQLLCTGYVPSIATAPVEYQIWLMYCLLIVHRLSILWRTAAMDLFTVCLSL
jgi:hypothetical protein